MNKLNFFKKFAMAWQVFIRFAEVLLNHMVDEISRRDIRIRSIVRTTPEFFKAVYHNDETYEDRKIHRGIVTDIEFIEDHFVATVECIEPKGVIKPIDMIWLEAWRPVKNEEAING